MNPRRAASTKAKLTFVDSLATSKLCHSVGPWDRTGSLRASLRARKPRWFVVTDVRCPCRTVILPGTAAQVLKCWPLVVSLACPRACRLPACGLSALSSCMGLRLFSGCAITLLFVTVVGL